MKIYVVGGAIRDQLLGLPVKDLDYVVVGATPEQMLAQGYTPVGKISQYFYIPSHMLNMPWPELSEKFRLAIRALYFMQTQG